MGFGVSRYRRDEMVGQPFRAGSGAELMRHRSTSRGQSKGHRNETTFNAMLLFNRDVCSRNSSGQYGSTEREPDSHENDEPIR